jgi:hypothetical protein
VNWRGERSNGIIPVAELLERQLPDGTTRFEFGYLQASKRAMAVGFEPFVAFPNISRRYVSSTLFQFFQNRVLPTTRPDYLRFLETFGLDPRQANTVDILGRSLGHRQTDQIETVLEPEHHPVTDEYVTYFLVRGVRWVPGADDAACRLSVGQILRPEIDVSNESNPRARLLFAGDETLGYLADYLVDDLDRIEASGSKATFAVERVNPPPHPSHHRVLVRMSAPWPPGFHPFGNPELAPIVAAADAA